MSNFGISQAPGSSNFVSGPYENNAGDLKNFLHGISYQLRLLMLFLIRGLSKGYDFRLYTEMKDAEKFDDLVFWYTDEDKGVEIIRFLQAKHKLVKEDISINDLLTETDGKFSLQKYFISYRKITKNLVFKSAQLKTFIIFTNMGINSDLRDWLSESFTIEPGDILNMKYPEAKLLKMKPNVEQVLLQSLYKASDLRRLVKKVSDCVFGKKQISLTLNDPLFKQYHRALAQNVIDVTDFKNAKFKSTFINLKNSDGSSTKIVKRFRDLLSEAFPKLSEDKFRKKLKDLRFTVSGRFGKHEKGEIYSLPDDEITKDEVLGFLNALVFAVNQPNDIELGDIIKSEVHELGGLNLSDVDLMASKLQEGMLNWMKNRGRDCLNKDDGIGMLNDIIRKIVKLMFAGITKDHRTKLNSFGIEFDKDEAKLNEFLNTTNENQIFNLIVEGSVILGSLIVHQTLEKRNYLKDDSCIFVSLSSLLRLKALVKPAFESITLLIIEFEEGLNEEELTDVFQDLCVTLEAHPGKKCVLVTQKFSSSVKCFTLKLGRKLHSYEKRTVNLSFTDLNEHSRSLLLKKGKVSFQGERLSLIKLVSEDDEELRSAIDGEMLRKIMNSEEMQIGTGLDKVKDYCVDRTLQRAVRISPKLEQDSSWFIVRNDDDLSKLPLNKGESQNVDIVVMYPSSAIFNKVSKLMRNNECNIHWFKEDKNVLIWQETRGRISRLREYILNENQDQFITTAKEMLEITDKVVIISSEPGMGKSTLMTYIANNIKKNYDTKWIIRINLNHYTRALEEINCDIDKNKAIEFLLGAAHIKSDFEEAFLKCMIKTERRVILLLDGFDEISPQYKQKVLDLIQAYRSTEIEKIWITTRPHLKVELEEKFATFAYTLTPLSITNQALLIQKFWVAKIGHEIPEDKKGPIAEHILDILVRFSESFPDTDPRGEFAGIPLQTVLLAERFYDDVKKFCAPKSISLPTVPQRLDALDLYTRFIKTKYDIYCEEKNALDMSKLGNQSDYVRLYESFKNRHELNALHALFGEKILKLLDDQKAANLGNEIVDGTERTGIIVDIVNQIPVFVHRTFAEYFAANWFAERFKKANVKKFLRKVLFQSENEILRNFFDRILCNDNCKLHNEVMDGNNAKISKSLRGAEFDINAVDKGRRTALHLAAAYGDKDVINDLLNRNSDISVRDDLFGWRAAIYADRCSRVDIALLLLKDEIDYEDYEDKTLVYNPVKRNILTFLIEVIELVVPFFIIQPKSLLHSAVKNKHLEFAKYLLQNGFFSNAVDRFGRTAFHDAVINGSKDIVQYFLEFYSETLSSLKASELDKYQKKLRKFINVKDFKGNNSLCLATEADSSDVCEYLIQIYLQTLSQMKKSDPNLYFNELEGFFHWKNDDGDTPFSLAIANGKLNCSEVWTKKFCDCISSIPQYYEQIDRFFNAKNNKGSTPLHLAVLHHKSGLTLQLVKYVIESYSDALASLSSQDRKLYQNKLNTFINEADNEEKTPLCLARALGRDDVCEYLAQTNLRREH
jgi:ankyrin repeat protein